jgi:predicted GNAT family N-acyltransferase
MNQTSLHIEHGDWENLKPDAQAIRFEVFVEEQKVPADMEWDEMDAQSLHAVAYDGARHALGTGRLLPDGHIGRMAVRKSARGTGAGAAILQSLMQVAQQRGDKKVQLNAQVVAEGFYQRYGFTRIGGIFVSAGIEHIHMEYIFPCGN